MIETIKMIMNKLNRYYQKRRLRRLVRQLPGDMQSNVMHDLLGVIDISDRLERVRRTREIFMPYKEQLEAPYVQKVSDCQTEYSEMLDKARSNVIVPNFPMPHLSINHDVLEQKVKATLTIKSLEEAIMDVPQLPDSFLFFAVLGIVLSTVANYMILEAKFGMDWLGGNELLTAICNGLFSLLLDVFVAIALTYIMNIMPQKAGNGFTKFIGIAGALLLILSVCVIVFERTEIGTNVMTSVQDVGKVE